jgi:hypothetical protein
MELLRGGYRWFVCSDDSYEEQGYHQGKNEALKRLNHGCSLNDLKPVAFVASYSDCTLFAKQEGLDYFVIFDEVHFHLILSE